jgi:hypothetical protein
VKIAMAVAPSTAEYLDAHLAFHLSAGVDLVIVPADDASDDVRVVLDTYAAQGYVVRAGGRVSGQDGVDSTAHLAAEHAADWLIVSEPTEFWWPRAATIVDVLLAVPPRYGVVQALRRDFVLEEGEGAFAERMTLRDSLGQATAGDSPLSDRLRPIRRLQSGRGLHPGQPLRAWYPVEVLRYPPADAVRQRRTDDDAARRLEDGSLVADERLRDALRTLRDGTSFRSPRAVGSLEIPVPTVVDDALYAVECAAVGEVNLDRLDRQIRELEDRLARLEARFWPRVRQRLRRIARRPS